MCPGQELADTIRERTTARSENSRMPLHTKPKKNKPLHYHKRGHDPGIDKEPGGGDMSVCYRHL
jgi:hypothetical protein